MFYYIAPKVWASREGRIKKLKTYVDKLFIVFPFEKPYFDSKGISYIYKGNPLVDAVDNSAAMKETRNDFFTRNNLEDKKFIALLAGSRKADHTLLTKFIHLRRLEQIGIVFADRKHCENDDRQIPRRGAVDFVCADGVEQDLDRQFIV